ncbi:hypothetical protein [uncultured Clostridium sp.]|uniref:hypothetical protein n=1 Tax=uncultured Clostridium sp. TaxID=59620 RepID=UPI00263AAF33|nr:hypothetical protein [uncultured Clostridium sp.]
MNYFTSIFHEAEISINEVLFDKYIISSVNKRINDILSNEMKEFKPYFKKVDLEGKNKYYYYLYKIDRDGITKYARKQGYKNGFDNRYYGTIVQDFLNKVRGYNDNNILCIIEDNIDYVVYKK